MLQLMCSVISQLRALWHYRSSPKLASRGPDGAVLKEWRPWDHIQHKKEHVVPMLNPQGQYAVKIFWMVRTLVENFYSSLSLSLTGCLEKDSGYRQPSPFEGSVQIHTRE